MAVTSPTPSLHSMGYSSNLRGYSDFFASGFRAVSTRVKRRPVSVYSTTSDSSDTENETPPPVHHPGTFNIFRSRHQRNHRRTMSLLVSSPIPRTGEEPVDRRLSIASFSSRLFERRSFALNDENAPQAGPSTPPAVRKSSKRRRFLSALRHSNINEEARESWISTGSPSTPSAPNGQTYATVDPFASSPESKSFFIDLSDSSSDVPISLKRDSFLSMTTTTNSNSSPSISLLHYSPRRERSISMQTVSLPSRSRRSSFQCRGQSFSEKAEPSWILEEEDADFLDLNDDLNETRDDTAQIDWRQFHNDLLTVEEA